MSKFWPLVMWFEGVEGKQFRYYPSWAHHGTKKLPSFKSFSKAFLHARKMIGDPSDSNTGVITMFRPYVLEAKTLPKLFPEDRRLRPTLLVTRHAVNEDGIIEAEESHTQENE
jgi:hypothetical protein